MKKSKNCYSCLNHKFGHCIFHKKSIYEIKSCNNQDTVARTCIFKKSQARLLNYHFSE